MFVCLFVYSLTLVRIFKANSYMEISKICIIWLLDTSVKYLFLNNLHMKGI